MERFLNSDNGVMRALSKIFDIGWLSIIYVVFCIPVVTIGAATTSLYYVSAKVLRRNRSYVWREFWSCFKTNFKPATILWLIYAALYGLLWFNLNMVGITDKSSQYGGYLAGAYIAIAVLAFIVMTYVFPLLSRYDMKPMKILRFSLYMSFRHFLHTLALLVILVAAGFGVFVGFTGAMPVFLVFVPGTAGFLYTFPMEHILKKYLPEKEERKFDENGVEILEWYEE
ncbi:MAG: YesL family protein [Eubacterium sp.]|nr:YesL family protein [Eubacterium sp.]